MVVIVDRVYWGLDKVKGVFKGVYMGKWYWILDFVCFYFCLFIVIYDIRFLILNNL